MWNKRFPGSGRMAGSRQASKEGRRKWEGGNDSQSAIDYEVRKGCAYIAIETTNYVSQHSSRITYTKHKKFGTTDKLHM
jgi:hypothetical protein